MPARAKNKRSREDEGVELELPPITKRASSDHPPSAGSMVRSYHKAMAKLREKQEKEELKERRMKQLREDQMKREAQRKKAEIQQKRRDREREADIKRAAARQAAIERRRRAEAQKNERRLEQQRKASARSAARAANAAKTRKPARKPTKRKATEELEESDNAPVGVSTGTIPRQIKRRRPIYPDNSPFLRLPLEVREIIYTYLLAPDPSVRIRVCKGWNQTLRSRGKRQQGSLDVHTAIMRTNSQVADECVRVLYGCNEFEYRLRDAPPPSQYDSSDDAGGGIAAVDNDEYDDEYQDEEYLRRRNSQRSNRPKRSPRKTFVDDEVVDIPPHELFNPDVQININKFGHHCRRIRIVAEIGRDTPHYRVAMAEAINTFRNLYPLRSRLHTLTLEIQPQRDPLTNEVSFVDFFKPDADVIKALRALPCQYFRFLIHTEEPNKKTGLRLTEFTLDRRPATSIRRAKRGEFDMWADDEVALKEREAAAAHMREVMTCLPETIQKAWEAQETWLEPDPDEAQDWWLEPEH